MSSQPKKWRFWPVVVVSIIQPLNSSLISLAIPLYFYQQGLEIAIIGFVVTGMALSYLFSPLLLNKLCKKIGQRNSLIIGSLGIFFAQVMFYISLEPLFFWLERIIEGVFLGFIWPNLLTSISNTPSEDQGKYMGRYNLAWNSGVLLGYITGVVILFFVFEIQLIFYLGPISFAILAAIVIIFFEEPKANSQSRSILAIPVPSAPAVEPKEPEYISLREKLKPLDNHLIKFKIPLIIPAICVVSFGIAKGGINLIYPIKSEILGYEAYSVYFLTFVSLIAQTLVASTINNFSMRIHKIVISISLPIVSLTILLIGIYSEYKVFILMFIFIGFFSGAIYAIGVRFFIILNVQKQTNRYSAISESILGSMFFITPLFVGFLAEITLFGAYLTLSLILIAISVFLLILLPKLRLMEV